MTNSLCHFHILQVVYRRTIVMQGFKQVEVHDKLGGQRFALIMSLENDVLK